MSREKAATEASAEATQQEPPGGPGQQAMSTGVLNEAAKREAPTVVRTAGGQHKRET